MAIIDSLLPEYDREMASTRKVLERVPEGRFDWKPHVKSMSLGELAGHLARLPSWGHVTIDRPELDLVGPMPPPPSTSEEVLRTFDKESAQTRNALAAATDAQLMGPWTLKREGKTIFTMPKVAVLRSFVLNHIIHHRGQLTVYLRLNDVPLPSIYGPSADEFPF